MNSNSLVRIERLNFILGGILIATSALWMNREQALGVVLGVVIASINFSVLRRIVERWTAGAEKGNHMSGLFLIPKMGALLLAASLALWYLPISGATFALGFSVFVVSIGIETVRTITNPDPDEDEIAESESDSTTNSPTDTTMNTSNNKDQTES